MGWPRIQRVVTSLTTPVGARRRSVVDGEELVLMPVDFVRRIGVQIDLTLTWATGKGPSL